MPIYILPIYILPIYILPIYILPKLSETLQQNVSPSILLIIIRTYSIFVTYESNKHKIGVNHEFVNQFRF